MHQHVVAVFLLFCMIASGPVYADERQDSVSILSSVPRVSVVARSSPNEKLRTRRWFWGGGGGGGGTTVVHHYPPSINCPIVSPVTAPVRSTAAIVRWVEPAGASRISGPSPGSYLPEGITTVTYQKTADGLSNSCSISITVKVIRCPTPTTPIHGTKSCTLTGGWAVYGDGCTFSCDTGYSMVGTSTSSCSSAGRMASPVPRCDPILCQRPPDISNGTYYCAKNTFHFGDVCFLNCTLGFRPGKGTQRISCQANKLWSQSALCIENNKAPIINCFPQPEPVIAPSGKTTAIVNFTLPTANDHEDGNLIPSTSDNGPGSTFSEGLTTVTYKVIDKEGVEAYCEKIITVLVIRCSEPPNILHGRKQCNNIQDTALLDETCSFTCDSGYKLNGNSTVKCSIEGQFEPPQPTCDQRLCPSPPHIDNGTFDCSVNTFHYGDICFLNCSSGYRPGHGSLHISCQANQTWSPSALCIDNTPPVFNFCPPNITLYSDRGLDYTNATWPSITAVDPPTNRPARVTLNTSEPWGTNFKEGEHYVVYNAYDDAGNMATTPCIFKITVETVLCSIPNIHPTDKLLMYDCQDYVYGTVCPIYCTPGYPLAGPDYIICETDNSFPPVATWTWNKTSGIEPYCMVKNCSNLTAPANGAIACDKWMDGQMCQMQCNSQFAIPYGEPSDGLYACGTQTGIWHPKDKVPDCIRKVGFLAMRMQSKFSYNGSCPTNQSAQQQIKENFIKALKNSLYSYESCTNVMACKPENVQVTCGRVTRENKRQTTTDGVTIKFDVVIAYDESKGSGPVAFAYNEQRLREVADKLTKVAQSGVLNIDAFGLKVTKAVVEPQSASLDCPNGRIADSSQASCVGCPKGSRLDIAQKSCVPCPVGTYQDQDSSTTCVACPNGTSTATTGSDNKRECRGICAPGCVSPDGLESCSPCQLGSFQGMPGNQHCSTCTKGMITSTSGSTDIKDCLYFDLSLGVNSAAMFKPTTKQFEKLTYAVWVFLTRDVANSFILASWQDPKTAVTSMEVVLKDTIEITVEGSTARTSVKIPVGQWTHLTLQADKSTGYVSLFVGGQISAKQTMKMTGPLITQGHRLVIKSNQETAILSRLIILDDVVSDQTISHLSTSCITYDSPGVTDLTYLDTGLSSGVHQVIPSVCGEY